jgi:hypothetical protein
MSSPSDSAAKQAQANESARTASIANSTGQINQIFDNPARQAQYGQLAKDTSAYYTNQLNDQKTINDRNLKFAEARGGQIGGSVQADQGAQSGKDYLKGVLEAQRRGDAASASLQGQDQQSRANLIAAAQGGLDATSAASQAASAMRGNAQAGMAGATSNALGDTFGDFAGIYQRSQDAAALRNGQLNAYNTVYQPGFGATAPRSNPTGGW